MSMSMIKTVKKKNLIPSLSMLKLTLIENGILGVTQLCHGGHIEIGPCVANVRM